MGQKQKPAKLPGQNNPPKELSIDDLSLHVLDEDLKKIAIRDPENIYQCLLVQTARNGNKFVNAYAAGARAIL